MASGLSSLPRLRPALIAIALACSACPGDDVPSITTTGDDTTTSTTDEPTTSITTIDPDTSGGATVGETDGETTDAMTTDATTTDATTTDAMTTTDGGAECGNGMIEDGEDCESEDLGGEDCVTQGFTGGVLLCAKDCTFDTNQCTSRTCGNDVIEGAEACDGTDLGAETCITQGFSMGELACAADCTLDLSGCSNPMCGNDVIEMGEVCDGADLAGETCVSQGNPGGGTLGCLADCSGYDDSACSCEDQDIGGAIGPAVASGNTSMDDNDVDGTCGGAGGNDRTIRFTAPFDGTFVFDTFGSTYDTKLSLFSDCATEISCNDDTNGLQSLLQLDMVAGQQVIVVVDGFNAGTGDWVLNISQPAVCGDGAVGFPEVCDGANLNGQDCVTQGFTSGTLACTGDCLGVDISGCFNGPPCADQDLGVATGPAVAAGNTTGSDEDINGTCGGAGGPDHVMLFTATGAGNYTFDTFGSTYDTKLSLNSDCATELACNDDTGGTAQSQLVLNMVAGQQVLVTVDGFNGGVGDWVLNITPPAGGFVCQDQDIGSAIGAAVAAGTTVGADNDLNPSCGAGDALDQVIRFQAPAAAQYTFNTFGSTYDTVLALFSDCTTQLACNDDSGGLQSQLVRNMAAGEVVLILVDGYNGVTGNYTLNITSP